MKGLLEVLLCLVLRDESALREAFQKEITAKEPTKRVEAVKRLVGAKEEKTLELLAGSVKDEAKEVQVAAAETIGGCEDGAGIAIKPLCAVLIDKKGEPAVRLACAKALGKARYKADAIGAMIETIRGITPEDRHLHTFGAEVTKVLNLVSNQDFGMTKYTPNLYEGWWKENKEKVQKDDDAKREEYKKAKK